MIGAILVIAVGILADRIAPFPFAEVHLTDRTRVPSLMYLLGTDQFGRDILSRVIFGARISLIVGVASTTIGSSVGVTLGTLAGYWGGWVDEGIMRTMDVIMAFPSIVLGIALAAVLGPGLGNVILIIGLLQIPQFARITRGSVLTIKEVDYVLAARALGQGSAITVVRHVLPNCVGPIVVLASLTVSTAIGAEAALSFLGLGIQPPTPSWGNILSDGRQYILQAPWISTFSGLAITITILAFNFIGDGLRDAIDPRMQT
jgi:peptide/nickel transport system permease protein